MKIWFSFIDNNRQSESVNVVVDDCEPKDFIEVFNSLNLRQEASEISYFFIRKLKASHKVKILSSYASIHPPLPDYRIYIRLFNPSSMAISVINSKGVGLGGFYSIAELVQFLSMHTYLDKYIDKVVKFAYNGGTNPGKIRVVKVISSHGGDDPYITGHDLNGDNWKETIRNYSLSKISDEDIEIIE